MRRAATACALLAVTPLLLPDFALFRGEFKATLLQVVPWYMLGLVGFIFVVIVLRGPIAGLFGATLGLIRFLQTKLLRLFRL